MISVGSTVGNYRVIRRLGAGAMGSVFLAEHPQIGKKVALKVIHEDLAENAEMVSRFFTEARAVTQIGHDNIIQVQDFGQTPQGDSFIVMELLEGESLAQRLKAKKILSIDEALAMSIQIADGLAASHHCGIIHRDLKPDNIYLITRNGNPDFVKILDFGLAKLTSGGGAVSHKTKAGSVLGTPHYMAPEQCEGKPDIDHRVDIYALGCLMFQMMCGRVPFPGEGFGDVLVRHIREPPAIPSKLNPEITPPIERIILHALAKQKEFRFQSMEEMGAALRDPGKYQRSLDGEDPVTGLSKVASSIESEETAQPTMHEREVPEQVKEALRKAAEQGEEPDVAPEHVPTVLNMQAPVLPLNIAPTPRAPSATGAEPRMATRRKPRKGGTLSAVGWMAASAIGVVLMFGIVYETLAYFQQRSASSVVVVMSEPDGAEVLRDGDVSLGNTPLVLRMNSGAPPLALVLKKAGYYDSAKVIYSTSDSRVLIKLHSADGAGEKAAPVVEAAPSDGSSRHRSPSGRQPAAHDSPRRSDDEGQQKTAQKPATHEAQKPAASQKPAAAKPAGKAGKGHPDDVLEPQF